MSNRGEQRRTILVTAGMAGAGVLLAACAGTEARPAKAPAGKDGEEEVSPVEDLMREHGLLRRVLLVYGEIGRRIERREPFPPDALTAATGIVRRFVEDYHEKLEEEFVFPRFEKAQKQTALVAILREQHQAGRRVTDAIREQATPAALQSAADHPKLVASIRAFIRMYEPHSAREDTDLFPEFRALVGDKEYMRLGEVFEDKEHALFGPKGFEGVRDEVAQIEKAVGIHDLAAFTPR